MVQAQYRRWLAQPDMPQELKAELENINGDMAAVTDRFYRDLAFGTGGLRGVIGAGSNRMNIYTVRKATQGLAAFIHNNEPGEMPCVAIAHDSRINARLFAVQAACVLAANGIKAYLYPRLEPTPALSFATRALGCRAGICITASHNPAQYNGYKVYGADGCQITTEAAKNILACISVVDMFDDVKVMNEDEARAKGLLEDIPEQVLADYLAAVYAERMPLPASMPSLKVVYTPLNGAGLECVRRILEMLNIHELSVVPEQEKPDGHFPTCPYPNPEIREALQRGLELCEQVKPDLLLATDPDCDRVGIAVQHANEYALLTGNEVGVLLLDFICKQRMASGISPAKPVAVSTIVSTAMADAVAAKYGVELRRTLTGFKFIGEQIGLLEKQTEQARFIFGFEESYGYLSGAHVRDKDGVNAALLICQMTQAYKAQGMDLLEAMDALYQEHGYYQNSLHSLAFEGKAGFETMQSLMDKLRTAPPKEIDGKLVEQVLDYAAGVGSLPRENVLELRLQEGAKVIVRPSGTEPKLKLYLFAQGSSRAAAEDTLQSLYDAMQVHLK